MDLYKNDAEPDFNVKDDALFQKCKEDRLIIAYMAVLTSEVMIQCSFDNDKLGLEWTDVRECFISESTSKVTGERGEDGRASSVAGATDLVVHHFNRAYSLIVDGGRHMGKEAIDRTEGWRLCCALLGHSLYETRISGKFVVESLSASSVAQTRKGKFADKIRAFMNGVTGDAQSLCH